MVWVYFVVTFSSEGTGTLCADMCFLLKFLFDILPRGARNSKCDGGTFWAHLCKLHGGLICIAFCLSVCPSVCLSVRTGPKIGENNSYLWKYLRSVHIHSGLLGCPHYILRTTDSYRGSKASSILNLLNIFNDIGRWAHFNVKLHFLYYSIVREKNRHSVQYAKHKRLLESLLLPISQAKHWNDH